MWRFIFIVATFISAFSIEDDATDSVLRPHADPGFTCGSGFLQFGRFCRKVILPYFDCPAVEGNDKCADTARYCADRILTVPTSQLSLATRRCRDGFVLDRTQNNCVGQGVVEYVYPEIRCDGEHCHEKGGECMRTIPVKYLCTGGKTKGCEKLRYWSDGDDCPTVYTPTKYYFGKWTWCEWNSNNGDRFCPGSPYSPTTDWCFTEDICPTKHLHCSVGVQRDNKCWEEVRRSPEYFCPQTTDQNFIVLRFRCIRQKPGTTGCGETIEVDPVRICPDGYDLLEDGQHKCVSRTEVAATSS